MGQGKKRDTIIEWVIAAIIAIVGIMVLCGLSRIALPHTSDTIIPIEQDALHMDERVQHTQLFDVV